MIAGLERREDRRGDRGHAGRGRARGFGAFELDHAALEHRDRRIREARIDEAGILALEARLALLGGVVDVALGQEQRLRRLAELRAQGAGMDQAGFGTVWRGGRRGLRHSDLLCVTIENGHKKTGLDNFHGPGSQGPRPV